MTFKIGKLELQSNVLAAPLAGYTDTAWRILARRMGAALLFSEMVAVGTIVHNKEPKWAKFLENDERARPFGLQLFGSKPEWFEESLEKMGRRDFDLLDINMGCPSKKVVNGGSGSALMKTPEVVRDILKRMRRVYQGPLTVKIRSGWDEESINAVEIATIAEDCGVDAVTVHPRTRRQAFKGKADLRIIADVKRHLSIPVIGNGDIVDNESAGRMFDETGCDAIMIGRAAVARPWIFGEIIEGRALEEKEKFQIIWEHINLLKEFKEDFYVLNMIKKAFPKYFKGSTGVKEVSKSINILTDLQEALDCLKSFEHRSNGRH